MFKGLGYAGLLTAVVPLSGYATTAGHWSTTTDYDVEDIAAYEADLAENGARLHRTPAPKDSARAQQLENDITIFKRTVVEQGQRIEALERQLSSGASPSSPPRSSSPQSSVAARGWHNPASWSRVKDGMSESQVMSILGQPTSVENIGSHRTLFYRGEVGSGGFVSGNVKISQDRVYLVNEPVF